MADTLRDLVAAHLRRFGAETPAIGSASWQERFGKEDMFLPDADALLAPDSPFYPALRWIGETAIVNTSGEDISIELGDTANPLEWLTREGIVGPLADACLAAAARPVHPTPTGDPT